MGSVRRLIGVGGNAIASLIPMSLLTAAANLYGSESSGLLAVVTSVAAYSAQLCTAWLVESRLAGSDRAVVFPPILHVISGTGLVLWISGMVCHPSGFMGIILLLTVLEVSRNMSLVSPQPRRDLVAVVLLGAAALLDFTVISSVVVWVVVPLMVCATVEVRSVGMRRHGEGAGRAQTAWVVGETAINGLIQPLVVTTVLAALGGSAATGFRLTISVGNLFSPVLSFVRMRLLSQASRSDLLFSIGAFVALVPLVLGGDLLGLWGVVFREGWVDVSFAGLVGAVCWKLASLLSTVPFARLRRRGRVGVVFVLRAMSSCVFAVLALIAVSRWGTVPAVVWSFVVAEIVTAAVYCSVARRTLG